ncbi:MlaD family protein [Patulibacter defluvii]|uniref:MlaD family protein n=1 Tax=Patulibacter defluvii TaxID=3095358 RepID=UPI002A7493F0|nr:MlaD family protein [Patulibacter sp. DM4]
MSRRATPEDRRRRDLLLGLLVVVAIGAVVYLSTVAIDGGPLSDPYELRIDVAGDAPLLKDGDDVRIAGQRAGTVRRVEPARGPDGTPRARVTLALDEGPVGRGARATVRLRGIAGAVYVALEPGDRSRPLPDGARLGTAPATVQLSDVAAAFDARTRRALSGTLRQVGSGIAGRGPDLNRTLATLPATLDGLTPLARGLAARPGALAGLLGAADAVLRSLDADGALAAIVPAARRTLEAIPDDGLAATIGALPAVERQAARTLPPARALIDDVGGLAAELRPVTAATERALPSLLSALRRSDGIGAFARLGRQATPVLARSGPVLGAARDPAALLDPLTAPLGPLSRYLAPYHDDIVDAVVGFDRWGDFAFPDGQASGARAVRFSMVLTCHFGRNPYPRPGEASTKDRKSCR